MQYNMFDVHKTHIGVSKPISYSVRGDNKRLQSSQGWRVVIYQNKPTISYNLIVSNLQPPFVWWHFVLKGEMMKKSFILGGIMLPMVAFGNNISMDETQYIISSAEKLLKTTRVLCSGISDELSQVSGVAKTETAINAVGAAAGGGAVYAGLKKSQLDKEIETLMDKMCTGGGCSANGIKSMSDDDFVENVLTSMANMSKLSDEIANAEKKSKTLGNWRTGLMAGNTATNIASSIVAGINMNQSDLVQHVMACNNSLTHLEQAYNNLLVSGLNPYETPLMIKINKIKNNCGEIDQKDILKIENSMAGVVGIGAAGSIAGVVGTVVSAKANSNKIRNDTSETGRHKERNLNTTANVMAVAGTGTSIAGTASNAIMISKIKKLIKRAQYCEEVLQ